MNSNAEKTNIQFYRTFKSSCETVAKKWISRGYTGRIFKGSIELNIRFFGIWIHSEDFSGLRNLFSGFRKNLIFLECIHTRLFDL